MVSAIDTKELWECETFLVWERVRVWEVGMDGGNFFSYWQPEGREALAKGRWKQS